MLGTEPKHVLSTSILYNSLLYDGRFRQVPMSEAAPGDIIIASHRNQAAGYAGIVVDHGRIVSNSRHGVRNNSSLVEIQRSRQEIAIFRYIGVQKYRSYPLANQRYNPDEPRLPAGQPGGGQWTSGGSGTASDDDDDNNPKTVGEATKETGQAFLSGLASIAQGIRSILFPSEPDREPSKPKNIFQLDKEVKEAAEGIDMTKPKGLGHALAAGAAIAAGEALSEGGIKSAGSSESQGLSGGGQTAKQNVPGAADTGEIPTIGGRIPINSKYTGDVHPAGVEFTPQGFPNFGPHSVAEVKIEGLTGNLAKDSAMANAAAGLDSTPNGYVWHHVEDGKTMQLVPREIHNAVGHTGGAAVIRNGGFDSK